MDVADNLLDAFKILFTVIWEIIKWNPGIIVPTLVVGIIGLFVRLSKSNRNLFESVIGLFFDFHK